jgi:DNA-binding transcriptional ArsR family regulator
MEEIYKLHSEICKTLANPLRLKIINVLEDKERAAGYLLETIEISKANWGSLFRKVSFKQESKEKTYFIV